jgi:glycosyltransferase involved in cell wall biosynthesis
VLVSSYPPNPDGEAHYTWCVTRELAALVQGSVEILCHYQKGASVKKPVALNLKATQVTFGYDGGFSKRQLAPLYLWRHLSRRSMPDVVHFQAPHKSLYGGVYGEPLLLLIKRLKLRKVPIVITLHSLWLREDFEQLAQERSYSKWKRQLLERLYRWYLHQLFRLTSQVNAVVAGDGNPLIADFVREWGLQAYRLCAEPHPCEPRAPTGVQIQAAKSQLGLEGKRLVLAFGFVRPDKGFHYLLEAMAPLLRAERHLIVLITGEPRGPLGTQYAAQLQALRVQMPAPERVYLEFGFVPDEKMHLYLTAADVVVIPYTRVMGASGPMHHALGYGKPVVATNVGQNRGMAHVCYLVPPQHPEALREALHAILTSPDRWATYHQRAVEYASTHTWLHLARQYLGDYYRLLEGRISQ